MVGPLTLTGTNSGQAGGPGELIFLWSNLVWCNPSGTDLYQHVVDRPTQLICISDIYLLTCQQTNTKDIAGQSATGVPELSEVPKVPGSNLWKEFKN